jgi:hypothetical protein
VSGAVLRISPSARQPPARRPVDRAQLPVHNPVRVAEQVATVGELSGGRVSLGVGIREFERVI